jgi:hypothetical protein
MIRYFSFELRGLLRMVIFSQPEAALGVAEQQD